RKNRLGNEIRMVQQRRGRALHGLAKQEPWQHAREDEERIVIRDRSGSQALLQAHAENEPPTDQENQWVNDAPDPSHGRANETLLEITPDELKDEAAALDQIAKK